MYRYIITILSFSKPESGWKGAVNPVSYAEQMQKRKMLWKKPETGGAKEEAAAAPKEVAKPVEAAKPVAAAVSFNKWEATNFGSDEANEKFRRLMVGHFCWLFYLPTCCGSGSKVLPAFHLDSGSYRPDS